ncbi:MAG: ATPase [Planctomycetes bacterium]|nr:ATPase [Planctomycetota bacterium]
MHVLFLAPDTHVYNHGFVRGLKSLGSRVTAIGPGPKERLSPGLTPLLDDYRPCARIRDEQALLAEARALVAGGSFDRIETIDEPLVEPAAKLREALGVQGLDVRTARLCRDKVAMKAFLRDHGIACAQSAGAASDAEVRAFAERVGYPIVVKPVAGFGSLHTHRARSAKDLDAALAKLKVGASRRVACEEFVEGHEGFFDTICDDAGVRFDFASHYYPSCLEAANDRTVSPQIAVTNRIDGKGYVELRAMGRRVVDLLGLRNTGTHMEWFFGPKGLKFSEIGARPAGEKIWDMYGVANDFDVYREWALAVTGRPSERGPSRRLAAGSVQIRPDRDGKITGHAGVDEARKRFGPFVYECEIPQPGTPTKGLDKGWLVNTWFRVRHEDYDALRGVMTELGKLVRAYAS